MAGPGSGFPTRRRQNASVALIGGAFAFLLCGYEWVRGPSNALYLRAYGPQNLGFALAVVAPALAAILYGYNALLTRLGPRRTLAWTSLLSIAGLALLRFLIAWGVPGASAALYFLRQVYIVVLLEQYWSFVDSRLSAGEAARANGLIAGLGSLGGVLGGWLLGRWSGAWPTRDWLIAAALVSLPAVLLADLAQRVGGEACAEEAAGAAGGLSIGASSLSREPILWRLLLLVAVTQAFSVIVNLRFQTQIYRDIPSLDGQTAFYGRFYAGINLLTLAMQFALTPLALSALSPGVAQAAIPALHLGLGFWALSHPSLASCAAAYLAFKSTDYSLFRASKEMFYRGLSFDARYRAKELIDVLVYRFGKGGTAFLIAVLQRAGIMTAALFSWSALAGVLAWTGLALPLALPRRAPAPQASN